MSMRLGWTRCGGVTACFAVAWSAIAACSVDDTSDYSFGKGGTAGGSGERSGGTTASGAATAAGGGSSNQGGAASGASAGMGGRTSSGATGGTSPDDTSGGAAPRGGAGGDETTGGEPATGGEGGASGADGTGGIDNTSGTGGGGGTGGTAAGGKSSTGGTGAGGAKGGTGGAGGSGTLATGKACATAGQCATNRCVDGVCCASACEQTCFACNSASTGQADGTCAAVRTGTQDSACVATAAASCGNDGYCAAGGACRKHVSTTVCGAESCTGRQYTAPSLCDGAGKCVAGAIGNCPNNLTCNTQGACQTRCTTTAQCAGNTYCNNGACDAKKTTGECGAVGDEACVSGRCAGGSCCTSVPCSCPATDARDLLQGRGQFSASTLDADYWHQQGGEGVVTRVSSDATSCPISGAARFGDYNGIQHQCLGVASIPGPFKLTGRALVGTQAGAFVTCGMNFATNAACDFSGPQFHAEVTAPTTNSWTTFELTNIAPPAGQVVVILYCEGANGAMVDGLTLTY